MTETPALNREEALQVIGGDENLLLEFYRMYDDDNLNPHALRLHKGIMKKDFEEIRIGGYLLKCSAGYVGAKKIYALATELQRKGTVKDPMDSILKDYIEFLNEARKVKKEIAQIFKRPVSLDIADFDIFEKQIRTVYSEYFSELNKIPVSPMCQGCNIF